MDGATRVDGGGRDGADPAAGGDRPPPAAGYLPGPVGRLDPAPDGEDEPPPVDQPHTQDEAIAHAKAELRRMVTACRNGTGPRHGPGSAGSWPATGPVAASAGPSTRPGSQTGPREAMGGDQIARRVLSLPEVTLAGLVAAFVSLPGEPSTLPLLDALRARGVGVLLPVLRGDLDLDFREYAGTLVPGALGTREPPPAAAMVDLVRADVILVPAVAVDPLGHRLGRGGGSYDRALRRVRATATLVAVVDDHAIVEAVPVAAHDLCVSVIVTPTRLLRCR